MNLSIRISLLAFVAVSMYGQPLRCTTNAGVPPTVRYPGATELMGDILLNCTGGTPTAAGAPVPQSDLTIYLNTNVTSRILSISKDTWVEALLLIDEPHSGYNPAVPLLACGDANASDGVNTPGICNISGTGDGKNVYNGASSRPNVWQGRLNGDNSITWPGIPIDAPAAGGTRVLRITNVRASTVSLGLSSTQIPTLINMSVSLGGANTIPVNTSSGLPPINGFPSDTVAFVQQGMQSSVLSPTTFQQSQDHNSDLDRGVSYANITADFLVRFREGFFSSFKPKNIGSPAVVSVEQNQNVPGAVYNTESGFENIGPASDPTPNPPPGTGVSGIVATPTSAFPSYHGMFYAGVANTGTRVMLTFSNIPAGVSLWVPTIVSLVTSPISIQTAGRTSGTAYLMSTDANGSGTARVSSLNGGITGCSANITSAGGVCPPSTGLAGVIPFNGTALAVYEVAISAPFNLEDLSIPIAVSYVYNAGSGLPGPGVQTTVTASLAPLSSVTTASSGDPVPRFTADPANGPQSLFTIAKAQPAYTGFLDNASCAGLSGWAADRNQSGVSIPVSVYDGTTLLAKFTAGSLRSDVGALLGDTGLHGFSYLFASNVRDGNAHTIHVVYESSNIDLPGSPKTLNCTPRYAGSVDSTSCNGVSGWAADKNILNTPINVTLWINGSASQTITANLSRPDVGGVLGDNGAHGFYFPVGTIIANGRATTYQVKYETSTTAVVSPAVTLTCGAVAPVYTGSVDKASCAGITGWVADKSQLNTPIYASLWDSGVQVATVLANLSRPDVGTSLGDNGLHGFSFAFPPGYSNGLSHTLEVRFQNDGLQQPGQPAFPVVYGSPFTLTCAAATTYAGYVDSASCSGITGWVADRNRPNVSINVSLWDGGTQIASTVANLLRSDVGAFLGDNGLHAFKLTLPSTYVNGVAHALQVRYETSATTVPNGAINLTCGTAGSGVNYAGYVDVASCSGITGWAADRNRPNVPITVSLWDAGTQIASTPASAVRSDVGGVLSDNGAHGFSLPIPLSILNAVPHTLQVRYESSALQLPASPVSLTCGSVTNYAGSVDVLSCSTIAGWAADRNALSTRVDVKVYDGSNLIMTIVANLIRSDVGAYLGDDGFHAFAVPTPPSLRDGRPHTVTLLPGSSSTPLYGPQSLTCQP